MSSEWANLAAVQLTKGRTVEERSDKCVSRGGVKRWPKGLWATRPGGRESVAWRCGRFQILKKKTLFCALFWFSCLIFMFCKRKPTVVSRVCTWFERPRPFPIVVATRMEQCVVIGGHGDSQRHRGASLNTLALSGQKHGNKKRSRAKVKKEMVSCPNKITAAHTNTHHRLVMPRRRE
jgi:hypothetical protein